MSKISLMEASDKWGVSRATIYRKSKSGELSTEMNNGRKVVDSSEMIRVFGEAPPVSENVSKDISRNSVRNDEKALENTYLRQRIKDLETQIADLRDTIEHMKTTEAWMREQLDRRWRFRLPWKQD
jgi:TolA-binding protein